MDLGSLTSEPVLEQKNADRSLKGLLHCRQKWPSDIS